MATIENISDHYYFEDKNKTLSVVKSDSGVVIEIMNAVLDKKETFEISAKQMLLLIGLFNDVYVGENVASKDFLNDHYKQLKNRMK